MNILESERGTSSEVAREPEREPSRRFQHRGGIKFKLRGYLAHPQWLLCKYLTKDFTHTHTRTRALSLSVYGPTQLMLICRFEAFGQILELCWGGVRVAIAVRTRS